MVFQVLVALAWGLFTLTALGEPQPGSSAAGGVGPRFHSDRILVKPKAERGVMGLDAFHDRLQSRVLRRFDHVGHMQVVAVPSGETVESLIAKYRESGQAEFAEPDYEVRANAVLPNDPRFQDGTLWGLHNTGQGSGVADTDIDAPEAWGIRTSSSNIVVAIFDTGIRATHEELAGNMWTNPLDGSHGFNALTGTNNPTDDHGHGTLLAGVLGAAGNNGKGVVGVTWKVQIMDCKCLNSEGKGNNSDVIACMDFARTNGAHILVAAIDSPEYSQAMSNAIYSLREAGIILVASCGNNATNVDVMPRYPACYDFDNIVSVTYTTRSNLLGRYANYGAVSVDLAAPGAWMHSSFFTGDSAYFGGSFLEGTSFAAAYVGGALALVKARFQGEDYTQNIRRLLDAVDPVPTLDGKCATGGRLNVARALSMPQTLETVTEYADGKFRLRILGETNQPFILEATTNFSNWAPILTNSISSSGRYEFTDNQEAQAAQRFYRVASAP